MHIKESHVVAPKWADQVSPCEFARRQRGTGGGFKKGIKQAVSGPIRFDGASINRPSHRVPMCALLETPQHHVEETWKEHEISDFATILFLDGESFSVDLFSVKVTSPPLF